MTPENPFYDYYNSLKKIQQNRFLKVLDLYKKLQLKSNQDSMTSTSRGGMI